MSRESAITESVSYRVEECHFCESEVGLGSDIPEDEMVKPGLAVLVGQGAVSISEEHAGNWDAEVEFTGEQSDTSPPAVSGHILCTECAEDVHNYSSTNEFYQGTIPDKLINGTGSPNPSISNRTLIAIGILVLLLVVLLIV